MEFLAEAQRTAIVACGEAMDIESLYRSQLARGVVHDLRKLECLCQGGVHFLAVAVGMQVGVAKRKIQLHVAPWIAGHLPSDVRNGLFGSPPAFSRPRQVRSHEPCP